MKRRSLLVLGSIALGLVSIGWACSRGGRELDQMNAAELIDYLRTAEQKNELLSRIGRIAGSKSIYRFLERFEERYVQERVTNLLCMKAGPESAPVLVEALADFSTRSAAEIALYRMPRDVAVPALEDALCSDNESLREVAANVLMRSWAVTEAYPGFTLDMLPCPNLR